MADIRLRRTQPGGSKRTTRVVLGLALLLIVGSIVLRSGLLGKKADGTVPEGYVKLPLANGPIAPLARVEQAHLQFSILKKELVSPDWITDPQQIVGRSTLVGIPDKSPFKISALAPRSELSGAIASIRSGWVAVTLELGRLEAPLNLLVPGTSVAVLAERESDAKGAKVAVICTRALVLTPPPTASPAAQVPAATGLARIAAPKRVSGSQGGVTIQLTAEDAMKLVQAQKAGRIHLALLNASPDEVLNPTPAPVLETEVSVEIIRGTRRSSGPAIDEKAKHPARTEKE